MYLRVGAPDRRRTTRGTPDGGPKRQEVVSRILTSYTQMPGLALQSDEAARLFDVHPTICRLVLDHLVDSGQLRRDGNGRYCRR